MSPGELAKVHAQLEGMSNCTRCHILGKKVSNQKCLECHTELKSRIDARKGYHSSPEILNKECVSCHSDHHGVNFQIVRFAKEKFNHALSGFTLTGAHAKKQCADCHKTEFIKDQKAKGKKFTYLGLVTTCQACHADYHQQTLSPNCGDCHGTEAFKPAPKFDHARTKYPLSGKHLEVPCITCHRTCVKNGQKFQEFKGIRYENCVSCHKDVHNNKFGQNCTQCHSEQSFSVIKGAQNFDHNKTNFNLEGKHQKVACTACHKSKFMNALKFARCVDCHSDYHKGQLSRQGVSPDCSQCHTVAGFKEFSYTTEQHNQSAFRLNGSHLAIPCIACHIRGTTPGDTTWRFRKIGSRCGDCHQDIHKGLINEKYYPEARCENCHNEGRWSNVTFDHNRTNFALAGVHAMKSCRDCHFSKEAAGGTVQKFAGVDPACSACHKDIHAKQFETGGVTDCSRCHEQAAFKPATKFDHSKTGFPLDGKHRDVACNKCHKSMVDNGLTFILYKIKEFRCENCHH